MRHFCLLTIIILFAINSYAAAPNGKDVTTNPELYYSTNEEGLDSLALLPSPPAFDSIEFLQDQARYRQGVELRKTERGRQAVLDSSMEKIHESISKAFGVKINREQTPELFKLIDSLQGEVGDMATRAAKQRYFRTRPYVLYGEATCYPEEEEKYRNTGSYPSGYSAFGWAIALLLSEINPAHKEAILRRGFDIGQSRVICGYHWQSDVNAGRVVGGAAVAYLHSNPKFMAQFEKAKAEFAMLKRDGKVK